MSKTAKTVQVKDSELKAVIAGLERDLNQAFEVSKNTLLAKADDGSEPNDAPPEASDDSATPPSDSSASPSPDAGAGGPPPPGGAPAPDASAAPGGMPPPAADPAAQQPQLTPEALQAEYAQLAPEELDMHIQAAMAAKDALAAASAPMGAGAPAGMPPAASASPAPAAGASPGGMPPPAMKAEVSMNPAENTGGVPSSHEKANGGKVNKSESNDVVASLKAELDTLKKTMADMAKSSQEDIENITKITKMVMEQPVRKAVTSIGSIEYFKKGEAPAEAPKKTYTNAEAKAKIAEIIPSLNKAERDLVTKFSVGMITIAELAPVLEKHLK